MFILDKEVERMKRQYLLWILLGLIIFTSTASIDGSTENGPLYGGELIIVSQSEPETLDAHKFAAAETGQILYNIYEGLVGIDPGGEIIPKLAKRWDISTDNRVYTFYLRDDVYFHNGRLVVADDVKFSFERILDPDTGHPQRSEFIIIDMIEVLDMHTVKITLSQPAALFLSVMAEVAGGAYIIPREAVDTLAQNPVGTGPFEFVHFKPNEELKLKRNDNYWVEDLPYLDSAVFKFIPDTSTALMNLVTGAIHVLPRIAAEFAAEIEANPETKLEVAPQNMVQLVILNHTREPLDDVRIRQALKYGTDKEEIIEGVMWGYGYELGSHMSPVMEYYYKDLTDRYSYDPMRAKELLAEAGYPDGFSMTLSLPAPYHPHVRAGEILAAQLEPLGIKLDLELVEWAIWLDRIYNNWDYDMTIIGFVGKLDPHTILRRYVSDYRRNMFSFKNEEYDHLIEKGIQVTDPIKRREIYGQAQEILSEEAVSIYIQDPHLIVGMRAEVEGWQSYPVYVVDLAHMYMNK